jgi:hypothetical protein
MIKSFSEFKSIILTESAKNSIDGGFSVVKTFAKYLSESVDARAKVAEMSNDEALEKAEKIMEMSTLKIFTHYPMFRPFLDLMPPIAKFGAGSVGPDGIGTMSTSGSAIFYDPKFVVLTYEQGKTDFAGEMDERTKRLHFQVLKAGKRHPSDYITFVLIHEILHNSLKHFLRKPVPSNELSEYEIHTLWNIATDYEINHTLKPDDMIRIVPGGVDAEEGAFEVPDDEKEFFTTSAAEKIFWRLLKNIEEKRREEAGEDSEDEGEPGGEGEGEPGGDEGSGEGEGGSGEDSEGEGEPGGDEGSGEGGSGDGSGDDRPLRVGDVIVDHDSGSYGKVTAINGDDVEYEEISKEQADSIINFSWLD